MSVTLTVNGVGYSFPTQGDSPPWGTLVVNWATAVTAAVFPRSGSFTLTGEVDFGGTAGLKALYFKGRTANPSTTGVVRLANTDAISWRNAANSADLSLKTNASNQLETDGADFAVKNGAADLFNFHLGTNQYGDSDNALFDCFDSNGDFFLQHYIDIANVAAGIVVPVAYDYNIITTTDIAQAPGAKSSELYLNASGPAASLAAFVSGGKVARLTLDAQTNGCTLETDTSTASAKIARFVNSGVEKASVDKDGNISGVRLNVDNGATDSGAVYFNAGTTSFLKGTADGTSRMTLAGFGGLEMTAANITKATAPQADTLYPNSMVKAWAMLTIGAAGAVTVTDGFNIASASYSATSMDVNFHTALASASVCVVATMIQAASAGGGAVTCTARGTGSLTLKITHQSSFAFQNYAAGDIIDLVVFGTQ